MRWGSRGLLRRSGRQRRNCPTSRQRNCVNWHGCASGSRRTSQAVSGSYIERLTWAFRSSPGMCARSRASSPPPFFRATQLRRRSVVLRLRSSLGSFTTARTRSGKNSRALIEAAAKSVGSHHSEPYRLRIKYLCEDLDVLRRRLQDLARDVELKLDDHEVGKLRTTIDGVGPLTAACLIAELGDPARFRSAGAIASYVGVARLRQSGKKRFSGSPTIPFGN